MKQMSYSHLYTLNDVNDGLNNFDLSTLPQDYVTNMVVNALQRSSFKIGEGIRNHFRKIY